MAGIASMVYGVALLLAGVTDYWDTSSPIALVIGFVCCPAMLVAGRKLVQRKLLAAYVVIALGILTGLFYGYRFIATAQFIPGGLMLIISFVALFTILAGLFTWLAKSEDRSH